MAVGEEAVVADAMESIGQGVQQEAADELVGGKGHDLGLAMMSIVPPLEGDLSVGDAKQTRVGDRNAVCVAAEIGQDLSGAAEWRLGVDHPLDASQVAQPASEHSRISKVGEITEESQLVGLECRLHLLQEQSPEYPRQHPDRQEESWPAGHPAGAVERRAAPRHDAVDMGVMLKGLPPGMQHGDNAELGTEMAGVGTDDA